MHLGSFLKHHFVLGILRLCSSRQRAPFWRFFFMHARVSSCLSVYRLAASATPKSPADIVAIKSTGIKHVYTLTEEEPLPASFFSLDGPHHTFSPVPDGRAPTFAQVPIMLYFRSTEKHAAGGQCTCLQATNRASGSDILLVISNMPVCQCL